MAGSVLVDAKLEKTLKRGIEGHISVTHQRALRFFLDRGLCFRDLSPSQDEEFRT